MINKIIFDLDDTLCFSIDKNYAEAIPNVSLVNKIKEYKKLGFHIVIFTSRNMNSYNNNIELIKKNTLPKITKWLKKNNIIYDELIIGKPWCGPNGFYVDDRSIRPDEFINLNYQQIKDIIAK